MKQHPNTVANWRHCGLQGSVRFAQQKMRAIIDSPTCTSDAKCEARLILGSLQDLEIAMADVVLPEPRKKVR